jgi:hypothetical protein
VALLAAQGRDHIVASVGLIEIVPYARARYSLFTSTTAIGFAVDDGGKRMSDSRHSADHQHDEARRHCDSYFRFDR